MFNFRVSYVIFSAVKRNFSIFSVPRVDRFVKCSQFSENFYKINCGCVYTNLRLQSSEVHAEKPSSKELSADQLENELNDDDIGKQLNDTQEEGKMKVDRNDELDSKIGKYADLAADSEEKKKILMILMEHEVAKLEGKKVPSKIPVEDMRELLNMYSFSSRIKYLGFLFEKELRKDAAKRKKEFKRKERESWLIEKQNVKPPEHIQYGIGHNTMILRVRKKSIFRLSNQRLANSVMFGQKIIIDVDYDCFMRKRDCTNCGEQLLELYGANRKNRYPFDLMFCNVDFTSTTMALFRRFMPNLYAPDNFITTSELSYLDLFPKEKLVYITPYAKEPLKYYDHNAIYILGGLVDKCIKEPVVLAKAKREGIRAVHLPFDEYLMWGRSNKSLPLNHILEILLEMKHTNDWNKAFRFVPQRKLVRSLDLFSEF